jgi:hypothetical protein
MRHIKKNEYRHFTSALYLSLSWLRAKSARGLLLSLSVPMLYLGTACDDELPNVGGELTNVFRARDSSVAVQTIDMGMTWSSGGEQTGATSPAGSEGGEMWSQGACLEEGAVRKKEMCGLEICAHGEWVAGPNSERCNDHDDDCDGQVDESFSTGGMCFVRDALGCQFQGEFQCNLESETPECISTGVSVETEVCDGGDNDCDGEIDEGFDEAETCCSDTNRCPDDQMCISGLCQTSTTSPSLELGTCEDPINLEAFREYSVDGSQGTTTLGVGACTGDSSEDLELSLQTSLGNEVVFRLQVNETQRVSLSTVNTLFATVVYVYDGACSALTTPIVCDRTILNFPDGPREDFDLTFNAIAGRTYYVAVDTKFDPLEVIGILLGEDIRLFPFVLNYQRAN